MLELSTAKDLARVRAKELTAGQNSHLEYCGYGVLLLGPSDVQVQDVSGARQRQLERHRESGSGHPP